MWHAGMVCGLHCRCHFAACWSSSAPHHLAPATGGDTCGTAPCGTCVCLHISCDPVVQLPNNMPPIKLATKYDVHTWHMSMHVRCRTCPTRSINIARVANLANAVQTQSLEDLLVQKKHVMMPAVTPWASSYVACDIGLAMHPPEPSNVSVRGVSACRLVQSQVMAAKSQ
jgi:hypothetical protein